MRKKLTQWFGLRIARLVRQAEKTLDAEQLPSFANEPQGLKIESPSRIINAAHIMMGDNVSLGPGCMINAIQRYPGKFLTDLPPRTEVQSFNPSIEVGDRVSATGYLTISAVQSVVIEEDVIFASHVFVSDHAHGRRSVDIPYKYQPLDDIASVRIGKGSWIGEHAVLMPGVNVGEYAIVGANSVVNKDVPARSIVAGAPARVVRTWSESESDWVAPKG
ncbi:MAG: acyltransferase [Woeseiaceae bacterium]|nr:acyltransferase [Woeseiaceae bacterium]